jgi:lambda repressor-like predicted transcriptional regulator
MNMSMVEKIQEVHELNIKSPSFQQSIQPKKQMACEGVMWVGWILEIKLKVAPINLVYLYWEKSKSYEVYMGNPRDRALSVGQWLRGKGQSIYAWSREKGLFYSITSITTAGSDAWPRNQALISSIIDLNVIKLFVNINKHLKQGMFTRYYVTSGNDKKVIWFLHFKGGRAIAHVHSYNNIAYAEYSTKH